MTNIAFIATSLDGYIADKDHNIDWLHQIPNPENADMGFSELMQRVDALIMGRNTFEVILGLDCDWPYSKPVFVLSHSMTSVPQGYEDKVSLLKGELPQLLEQLKHEGFSNFYIDGGKTIQSFLQQDLIDEMIITTIPTLLGAGIPLFSSLAQPLSFTCIKSERLLDAVCQNHFIRQQ